MATKQLAIEVGTIVLFHNQWTGYDNADIKKYFRPPTGTEIADLKPGDIFWFVDEPHANGKVYGYRKAKVTKIHGERIHYSGGAIHASEPHRLRMVDDELPVLAAIAADPLVTDVIGEAGRLAGALGFGR